MLALQDQWIWDFWLFNQGTLDEPFWHVWFLQADKSLGDENLRHWNVSHGHATSRDLKQWTHLGTSFAPAPRPACSSAPSKEAIKTCRSPWLRHSKAIYS